MTHLGESNSTPSDVRQLSRESVRNHWKDEETDGTVDWSHAECWPCHNPIFISPSWSSAPLGLALPMGSRSDFWRNELLYRAVDIERHPGPKRALPSRGRGVLIQDILPTTAEHDDVAVSEFEKYLRVKNIHGAKNLSATVSMTFTTQTCVSRSGLTVRLCSTANGGNIATNCKKTQSP